MFVPVFNCKNLIVLAILASSWLSGCYVSQTDVFTPTNAIATRELSPTPKAVQSVFNHTPMDVRPTDKIPASQQTTTSSLFQSKRELHTQADVFAYSPDGKVIAVATGIAIQLIDPISGKPIKEILLPQSGEFSYTSAIAFSPDGNRLAFGQANAKVGVWDLNRDNQIFSVQLDDVLSSIQYSPDNMHLVTLTGGERSGILEVISPETGKQNQLLVTSATNIAISPNQGILATAESPTENTGYAVKLWELDDLVGISSVIQTGSKPEPPFSISVSFSKDERFLAAIVDGQLRLWDLQNASELVWPLSSERETLLNYSASPWQQVSFSPKGYLGLINQNGQIVLLSVETGELLDQIEVAKASVFAFSPDGNSLLVGGLETDLVLLALGESR